MVTPMNQIEKVVPLRSSLASLLVLTFVTLFSGCHLFQPVVTEPVRPSQPPVHTRSVVRSQHCDWGRLRKVVVVPVTSSVNSQDQNEVAERVATAIRGIQCRGSAPLDVYLIDPQNCGTASARGIYNEQQMAAIARHHSADGVLYCSLMAYSPYEPMKGELSISLVDSNESIVLLKAHTKFDLSDPGTNQDYQSFTYETAPEEFVAKSKLISPDNFLSYLVQRTMQPLAQR